MWAEAAPRDGMAVSSLLFSRLEETTTTIKKTIMKKMKQLFFFFLESQVAFRGSPSVMITNLEARLQAEMCQCVSCNSVTFQPSHCQEHL